MQPIRNFCSSIASVTSEISSENAKKALGAALRITLCVASVLLLIASINSLFSSELLTCCFTLVGSVCLFDLFTLLKTPAGELENQRKQTMSYKLVTLIADEIYCLTHGKENPMK